MLGVVLTVGSVAMVGLTAWATAATNADPLHVVIATGCGVVASLIRMPSIEDRRTWTVAPIAVLASGLLGIPHIPGTAAVVSGVVTADALRAGRGRRDGTSSLSACLMLLVVEGARPITAVPLADPPRLSLRELGAITVIAIVWFGAEALVHAVSASASDRAHRYHFGRALSDWMIGLVAISSGVTWAVLWHHSIGWALAVSVAPLVIALHLGARVASGRSMAHLTIRALGRLPEAAGLAPSGHSQAVADLAAAMGKLDGFLGPELAELETAAHLHDLGLLATTAEAVRADGFFSSDVAAWGADIMRESQALAPAAAIVEAVHEPFRLPGRDPDPSLDARAQIVQVACLFVQRVEAGVSAEAAVEDLYAQTLYQLDPRIVALIRPGAAISHTVIDERAWKSP